jgi:hypothetical protein
MNNIKSWQEFIAIKESNEEGGVLDAISQGFSTGWNSIVNLGKYLIDKISGEERPTSTKKKIRKRMPKPYFPSSSYTIKTRPKDIPMDQALYIVDLLVNSGLSIEGASAVVGNMWDEGFLNPNQLQLNSKGLPTGPGTGLIQWEKDVRWKEYKQFFKQLPIKTKNKAWNDFKEMDVEPQIAFLLHELEKTERYAEVWEAVTQKGSVRNKAIIFLQQFEIAAKRNEPEEQNKRAATAQEVYYQAIKNPYIKESEQEMRSLNTSKKTMSSDAATRHREKIKQQEEIKRQREEKNKKRTSKTTKKKTVRSTAAKKATQRKGSTVGPKRRVTTKTKTKNNVRSKSAQRKRK